MFLNLCPDSVCSYVSCCCAVRTSSFALVKFIGFFCPPQLQEAFAKGLLKPGMNVLANKQKKLVNSVVSFCAFIYFSCRVQSNGSGQSSVPAVLKRPQNNNMYFMDSCANQYVILSCRRVWSGALQTSVKICPGWRGWTWLTHQPRTFCQRWRAKLLMWPTATSASTMTSRGRCSCESPERETWLGMPGKSYSVAFWCYCHSHVT